MRPAEGGQEIVERHLVRQVLDGEPKRPSAAALPMEEIVGSEADVKQIARSDPVQIVVVILGAGLGQSQ